MSKYPVDKNRAIPVRGWKRYPFRELEVGDSFPVESIEVTRVRSACQEYRAKTGYECRTLKDEDGTYRVWRVS